MSNGPNPELRFGMTLQQARQIQLPSRNSKRAATAGRELWVRRQRGPDPAADASGQSAQGVGSGLGPMGNGLRCSTFSAPHGG